MAWLTVKEAAATLRVTKQTLHGHIQDGLIRSRLAEPHELDDLRTSGRVKIVPHAGIRLVSDEEVQRYERERRAPGPQIRSRQGELKRCGMCKQWLHISEFGLNRRTFDGRSYRCKRCHAAQARDHKQTRRAEGRERTYETPTDAPKRCNACQQVKEAAAFGLNRHAADGRNYTCRECRRAQRGTKYHRYRPADLDRQRARGAVSDAVRRGKMPAASTLPCAQCGGPASHYHHHNGYDKGHRLDVVPLCPACHGAADRLTLRRPTGS